MEKIKVQNMMSCNGNYVPNQFVIYVNGKKYFQSYGSIIAVIECGHITLDRHYWDYSRTTGKYRNIFLGEDIEETRRKIRSGEYSLANLN